MTPTSEQELSEAITSAKGPLRISGGGTRDLGNPVIGEALGTSGLSGITLYEPGALTLVAKAGTPLVEVEAALDQENQRLAFEPMDHRALLGTQGTPTLGGAVSVNASGPRRIAVGACRDHVLGVRFVDGTGAITKNGGRVMKNVTGYDLVKLLTGAYGTLGVLSEVSLKVLPKPETDATLTLKGLDEARAVEAMSAALGSPFEVTGAATDVSGTVHLRIEGFEASVAYRTDKLREVLAPFGEVGVQSEAKDVWQSIRDVSAFADKSLVVAVSIKPSELPKMIAGLREMFIHHDTLSTPFDVTTDWGGGLVWVGASNAQLAQCAETLKGNQPPAIGGQVLHEFLQSFCAQNGGHATLIKAPAETRAAVRVFQPENPTIKALSAGLRAQFDPRGILNAGLMG